MRDCVFAAAVAVAAFVVVTPPTVSGQGHDGHSNEGVNQKDAASIEQRLAETKLKLAEIELRQATDWNRRLPRTIPESTVDWLRRNVELAKEQVDIARQGEPHWHSLHIRQMEAALRTAESKLDRAEATNRAAPRSGGELNLERLRLKVELARLNLAKAKDPANIESPEAHLQWQVDQLRDEVDRMKDQMERLSITSEARSR